MYLHLNEEKKNWTNTIRSLLKCESLSAIFLFCKLLGMNDFSYCVYCDFFILHINFCTLRGHPNRYKYSKYKYLLFNNINFDPFESVKGTSPLCTDLFFMEIYDFIYLWLRLILFIQLGRIIYWSSSGIFLKRILKIAWKY